MELSIRKMYFRRLTPFIERSILPAIILYLSSVNIAPPAVQNHAASLFSLPFERTGFMA